MKMFTAIVLMVMAVGAYAGLREAQGIINEEAARDRAMLGNAFSLTEDGKLNETYTLKRIDYIKVDDSTPDAVVKELLATGISNAKGRYYLRIKYDVDAIKDQVAYIYLNLDWTDTDKEKYAQEAVDHAKEIMTNIEKEGWTWGIGTFRRTENRPTGAVEMVSKTMVWAKVAKMTYGYKLLKYKDTSSNRSLDTLSRMLGVWDEIKERESYKEIKAELQKRREADKAPVQAKPVEKKTEVKDDLPIGEPMAPVK